MMKSNSYIKLRFLNCLEMLNAIEEYNVLVKEKPIYLAYCSIDITSENTTPIMQKVLAYYEKNYTFPLTGVSIKIKCSTFLK